MLKKLILMTIMVAFPVLTTAQSLVPGTPADTKDDGHGRKLWIASLCAVAGASALDAATSWGKLEGNPILASGNGTFGARGISIKAGLLGVVLVRQITMRHRTDWRTRFTIANFAGAALYGGVAAHNTTIAAPPHN